MAPLGRLLLAAFPAVSAAVAADMAASQRDHLAMDDECDASDETCALNAAQLRAEVRKHQAAGNASLPTYTTECFSFTGGTCVTASCDASRNAECIDKKCLCEKGCSGADGKCHDAKNTKVASKFYLSNGKYDKYKMYFQAMSAFGQMKTTKMWSSMNNEQDLFDLFEVAGGEGSKKTYFLASSKWQNQVVGFKATTGTAISPFGAYAVDLAEKASVLDTWGPSNIMLKVCSLGPQSSYPGAIQIGSDLSDKTGTIWAYVHTGSYLVYGSITSPGEGGIWIPEPPLPASVKLPLCE